MDKSFTKIHFALFALALVVMIAGFWMLAQGPWDNAISLTWAPLVLCFGFLVLMPAAILWPAKASEEKNETKPSQTKAA